MVEALTAVIIALLFGATAAIFKLIKRASMDPKLKDIEKVLESFGNSNDIEFEIVQGNGETSITKKVNFKPEELSLFIKMKYQEKNEWDGNQYELFQKVKEQSNIVKVNTEYKEITHDGLRILCPNNWITEKFYDKIGYDIYKYPSIKCRSENGISISIRPTIKTRSLNSHVESIINEIKGKGNKFIYSNPSTREYKEKSCYYSGYAYEINGTQQYGMILAFLSGSYHIITLIAHITNNWSELCGESICTIIDSIQYDNHLPKD